jgi:hypothetical protein
MFQARTKRGSGIFRLMLMGMFTIIMIDSVPDWGIGIVRGLSAQNLFLYILTVLIAVRGATNPNGTKFYDLDVHWPFLVLIFYAILTWGILTVVDPTYSTMRGAIRLKNGLVEPFLLMFVFRYGPQSKEDYFFLLRFVIGTLLFISVVTLLDFLDLPDLGLVGTHQGRIEGPIGEANQYGALLGFMIPIALALMPTRASKFTIWAWRIGFFISAILLVATGSRGAAASIIAGSMFAVFYLRDQLDFRQILRYSAVGFLALACILVGFLIFNFDFIMERFEKTTTGSLESASSGRLSIWTAVIKVMLEKPVSFIVGYGYNSYSLSGIWKSTHNVYLNVLYELGAIGLTVFVALLRSVVKRSRAFIRRATDVAEDIRQVQFGYLFGMFIIFVNMFFVELPIPWGIVWIVTGLVIGLQFVGAEEPREKTRVADSEVASGSPEPNYGIAYAKSTKLGAH